MWLVLVFKIGLKIVAGELFHTANILTSKMYNRVANDHEHIQPNTFILH